MFKDPLLRWSGRFPYEVLAGAGVTPDSTIREILDASFDLMAQGRMTAETRQAWDELRLPSRRLVVDFFLYTADPPRESEPARIDEGEDR
ncbi:MAG TPA: hypothetical protein VLX28_27150 [Thermoanaerobaculia bacterium]|nr:hypothetical protein [Thermoanaerobaculia bacterium]